MQHQEVDQILTYSTIYDLPILADHLSHLRKFDRRMLSVHMICCLEAA